jgi:RNA polymerase sigma-70 factor (ECF subfamily)
MAEMDAELTMLYRQHLTLVRGRARRILGDAAAADDVTQEVFMKYWQHRRSGGDAAENTAAFLYTMATRCALNALRGGGRRKRHEDRAQAESQASHDDGVEQHLEVVRLLARVPEREAILASYYYLDGLEQEEIATLLDMPRRQVGRGLDAFRERARRLLGAPLQEVPRE